MRKIIVCVLISCLLLSGVHVCGYTCSAVSVAVINGDTGELLFGKAENEQLPFASTTKIMTAWLLCEKFPDLQKTVKISRNAAGTEGSSMGLKAGDTVTVSDLLYGMMLSSGNDAANAAAEAVSGDIESFVALMNKRAYEIGLKNTHFDTPSGLDGKSHYTSAVDLATLTRLALQNENLQKAVSTKNIILKYGEDGTEHFLKNHNRLLFMYDDVIGVKTGYTKKAGRCLVSAAKRDGKYVIVVTLSDKNDFKDHRELIDLGYNLLGSKKRVTAPGDAYIPIASGGSLKVTMPGYTYFSAGDVKVSEKVYLPHVLYLPVKKGEELGTVEYFANYKSAKRITVKAESDVSAPQYSAAHRFLIYFRIILRI